MYYLGIDLGGTNIAVGVVDENCKIVKKGSVPTKAEREADEIIADMAKLCKDLVADCSLTMDDIEYAGIATPGTANRDTGIIVYANNLPFMNYPIAQKLSQMSGVKRVMIENDANAAAKAEAVAGAAKGAEFSVMITLGTGVGGGIVLDGQVYSGFNFAGAELGHMVIEKDGRPCSCGRNGCWESYSSATGLVNMTKDKLSECHSTGRETLMDKIVAKNEGRISGKTAFSAMKSGDAAAAEVVEDYIDYLACGLTNILRIFQPDVLSIGGGICNEGDNSSATGLVNMTKDKLSECHSTGRETLMDKIVAKNEGRISGKTAFSAMKSGDAAAAEVVEDYIDYLACGLTNILRIFQPDVLSIGGGICNEGDNLLVPLKKKIDEMLHLPDYAKKTEIKIAEMGNDAGIIGAATLGM